MHFLPRIPFAGHMCNIPNLHVQMLHDTTRLCRQKHGLVTAVAFAALAGALAVCDIDAHDVLPHFTDLQLSLLLDELDYTTLMLIDFAMRHVAGVPPML